jgi:anti-sigma B factor antagonist
MSLEIENADKDGVLVLELKGSLDASSVDQLNTIIKEMSEEKGTYRLVLSLNALEFISSAGWSVLVETSKEMKEKNGDVRLSEMRQPAQRIFRLMGLEACLQLYPSASEAVKSYAE